MTRGDNPYRTACVTVPMAVVYEYLRTGMNDLSVATE